MAALFLAVLAALAAPAGAAWSAPTSHCACANAAPLAATVGRLEAAFATQVAGRARLKQTLLAMVRAHASALEAGRASPLRIHLTGPSGVGKSFLAKRARGVLSPPLPAFPDARPPFF